MTGNTGDWIVRRFDLIDGIMVAAAAGLLLPVMAVFVSPPGMRQFVDTFARYLPSSLLWFLFAMTLPGAFGLLGGILARRVSRQAAAWLWPAGVVVCVLWWSIIEPRDWASAQTLGVLAGAALAVWIIRTSLARPPATQAGFEVLPAQHDRHT